MSCRVAFSKTCAIRQVTPYHSFYAGIGHTIGHTFRAVCRQSRPMEKCSFQRLQKRPGKAAFGTAGEGSLMADRGRDPLTTLATAPGGGMHAGVHRTLTRCGDWVELGRFQRAPST
jgi:hypothetical protein